MARGSLELEPFDGLARVSKPSPRGARFLKIFNDTLQGDWKNELRDRLGLTAEERHHDPARNLLLLEKIPKARWGISRRARQETTDLCRIAPQHFGELITPLIQRASQLRLQIARQKSVTDRPRDDGEPLCPRPCGL